MSRMRRPRTAARHARDASGSSRAAAAPHPFAATPGTPLPAPRPRDAG